MHGFVSPASPTLTFFRVGPPLRVAGLGALLLRGEAGRILLWSYAVFSPDFVPRYSHSVCGYAFAMLCPVLTQTILLQEPFPSPFPAGPVPSCPGQPSSSSLLRRLSPLARSSHLIFPAVSSSPHKLSAILCRSPCHVTWLHPSGHVTWVTEVWTRDMYVGTGP